VGAALLAGGALLALSALLGRTTGLALVLLSLLLVMLAGSEGLGGI
jgi:hypothetical protein